MASVAVNSFKGRLMGDNAQISTAIDLEADTMKFMLLDSNHTTDIDAQVFIDDVSTNEVSASGSYSAGGATLTVTSSTDDTNDLGQMDAADFSFTSATISADFGVLYKDTGTPSTSPIVAIYDFGGTISCTTGTFSVTVNTNGLIRLS